MDFIKSYLEAYLFRLLIPVFVIIAAFSTFKYLSKPDPIESDLKQICKIYSKTELMLKARKIDSSQIYQRLKEQINETIRSKKILKILVKIESMNFKEQSNFYSSLALKNGLHDWSCLKIQDLDQSKP